MARWRIQEIDWSLHPAREGRYEISDLDNLLLQQQKISRRYQENTCLLSNLTPSTLDRQAIIASLEEKLKTDPKSLVGNKGYRKYLKLDRDTVAVNQEKTEPKSGQRFLGSKNVVHPLLRGVISEQKLQERGLSHGENVVIHTPNLTASLPDIRGNGILPYNTHTYPLYCLW